MRYGYYPGCALERMSVEYDVSLHNLFDRLSVHVEEVPGWICCGTLAAPSTSRFLGLAVLLWNVARAAEAGQEAIVTPCSACLYHFKSALHQVHEDRALLPQVEEILGLPLSRKPHIMHPLELFSTPGFETAIREAVVNDLSDLQVVCYYGCLITRPPKVMQFDVAEYPQSMDNILRWAGIRTLDWACKTECCGANFNRNCLPSWANEFAATAFRERRAEHWNTKAAKEIGTRKPRKSPFAVFAPFRESRVPNAFREFRVPMSLCGKQIPLT